MMKDHIDWWPLMILFYFSVCKPSSLVVSLLLPTNLNLFIVINLQSHVIIYDFPL
jgi:hypothetical protein